MGWLLDITGNFVTAILLFTNPILLNVKTHSATGVFHLAMTPRCLAAMCVDLAQTSTYGESVEQLTDQKSADQILRVVHSSWSIGCSHDATPSTAAAALDLIDRLDLFCRRVK